MNRVENMKSPLLSIVVPVYNVADWLPKCLDSLVKQSYQNLEIICIDDGSTDASWEILQRYAEKDCRIKAMHQENAGVCSARNAGLDAASGELVTFVDSDDWLELEAYEKMVEKFTDEVDIVAMGTSLDGDTEDKQALEEYFNRLPYGRIEITPAKFSELNVSLPTKVYRREIIEQDGIRFPKGVAYGEDSAFVLCLLGRAKVMYNVASRYYHYVQRDSSVMHDKVRLGGRVEALLRAWEYVVQYYSRWGILDAYWPVTERLLSEVYGFVNDQESAGAQKEKIWELAKRCGLPSRSHHPQMHRLLMDYMPKWKKVFHWYRGNCECYGLFGFSLFSITYSREVIVFRVMGRVVYKRKIKACD